MNRRLEDYVFLLKGWLSKDLCRQTVSEMESMEWHQHEFYNPQTEKYTAQSGNRELDVSWSNISTKSDIMKKIHEAFSFYLQELKMPWFDGWKGFTDVRFNRYNEDRVMALHCDHIHSMFDGERKGIPTMTYLSMLNDDYIGGELIMWDNTIIDMEEGDAIVFPSCFLYPHKVEPVKRGVRYSCVSWAW